MWAAVPEDVADYISMRRSTEVRIKAAERAGWDDRCPTNPSAMVVRPLRVCSVLEYTGLSRLRLFGSTTPVHSTPPWQFTRVLLTLPVDGDTTITRGFVGLCRSRAVKCLLGAAAQLGVYISFFGALLFGFSIPEACSIGIIGGADGPTTIYTTVHLAPHLLGATAISAYSYMSLVPIIQPPVMKLLTTQKERKIVMRQLRPVSKTEKILFPIAVTLVSCLLVPAAAPLMVMFMLGNLFRESGVVKRLSEAAQNELMNIVTIFLGISVGATMSADKFLRPQSLTVFGMGLVAFIFSTAGGVLFAKFMNLFLKEKINPLIGSAGVSAVPMAARVSQKLGAEADPKNFLLMHAMGPNVAGVIGTVMAAGFFISLAAH